MDLDAQTNESDIPKKPPPSRLHVLQVQAFLEAAEDVEIDPDTVEDILDGFEDVEISLEDQTFSDQDTFENADEEDPKEALDDHEDEALFSVLSAQAEVEWTEQERKQIIYYLKERGTVAFVNQYVTDRQIPIPRLLSAFGVYLCPELREKSPKTLLYFLKVVISQVLQRRKKIPSLNTIDDAVKLIHKSSQILILTGAGISVSCGIPDFRSREGLYASLKDRTEYELDDPQQMFDIQYFREKPSVFYAFAREIYPSNFTPSPCHRFIKLIEDKDKLLRNYTQNIDTLETQAGVKRVLQCHGSFATATCVNCKQKVPGKSLEDDILNRRVSLCKFCNVVPAIPSEHENKTKKKKMRSGWHSDDSESDEPDVPDYPPGVMKPDITFFGEKLTDDFQNALLQDRDKVDLIIIIGTSLKVSPVSEVISHLPHSVPQILINKTPIKHINPDIIMLGNADDIILHLCQRLGWELPSNNLLPPQSNMKKRSSSDLRDVKEPERVANTNVWLFDGAEGGKWLQALARNEREGPSDLEGREPKKVDISKMDSEVDDDDQNGDHDYEDGIKRIHRTRTTSRRGRPAKHRKLGDTSRPDSPLQPLLNLLTSFIEGDDHDEDEVSFEGVIQYLLPELTQSRDLAWEKETVIDEHGNALRPLSRLEANSILAGLGEFHGPVGALTARKLKLERYRHLNSIERYPTSLTFGNTISPLPKLRTPPPPNSETLDALYAIQTTAYENSLLSRLDGFCIESSPSLLACDWESRTPWMELMSDIRAHYMLSHPESDSPFELEAPINYGSLQPWHIDQIHDILSKVFWPGINISDSFDYKPERCTVVATYKRLVVGVAIISSPQETYITYLAVKAGWDNAQIATNMLYHLISLNPRRDITLHVSTTNSAMLLYNRFGFKAEGFIAGFYEDYLHPQARSSKNAFRLRLRQ